MTRGSVTLRGPRTTASTLPCRRRLPCTSTADAAALAADTNQRAGPSNSRDAAPHKQESPRADTLIHIH